MREYRERQAKKTSAAPRLTLVKAQPAAAKPAAKPDPPADERPIIGAIESALIDELDALADVSAMDAALARRLARMLDGGADSSAVHAGKQLAEVMERLRPPKPAEQSDDPWIRAKAVLGALACFLPEGPGRVSGGVQQGRRLGAAR